MKKVLIILFSVPFIFISCTLGVWGELADSICSAYVDCIKGTTTYNERSAASCRCTCDEGWCGERCDVEKAACKGNLFIESGVAYVDNEAIPYQDCQCKCIITFFKPPACNTILIPFKPKASDSEVNKGLKTNTSLEEDYFPLLEGNKWVFDILDEYGEKDGEFGMHIPRSFVYDQILYYDTEFFIADTLTGLISDTSVMLGPLFFDLPEDPNQFAQRVNDTTFNYYFYHHYNNGDTLIVNDDVAIVDSVGTVTVPAGEYDECFALTDTFGGGFIFAPGVGWIAFLGEGGDFTAVLSYVEITCSIGAEIKITNASCAGEEDGEINIESNGDISDFTFIWEGPTEIPDVSNAINLSAGLYFVTINNDNCEAIVDSIPITESAPIEIELISATNVSCFGESDGAIDISVTGGSGHIDVLWNEGDFGTEDLNGLTVGCYIIEVMDSLGCYAEMTIDISEPDAISLTLESTEASDNLANGTVSVSISGGTPGYTFRWDDPDEQTTSTAVGLLPGIYNVVVTDQNGCSESGSIEVEISTGIEDLTLNNIEVYPNPVSDRLFVINHDQYNNNLRYEIINLTGKTVKKNSITFSENNIYEIEIYAIERGMYILKLIKDRNSTSLIFIKI